MLHTFENGSNNIGLFLMVLLASIAVGLVLSAISWVIYEAPKEKSDDDGPERSHLSDGEHLQAFRAAVDETYRYFQFYSSMTIVTPIFIVALIANQWRTMSNLVLGLLTFMLLALEMLLIFKTYDSLQSFRDYEADILEKG